MDQRRPNFEAICFCWCNNHNKRNNQNKRCEPNKRYPYDCPPTFQLWPPWMSDNVASMYRHGCDGKKPCIVTCCNSCHMNSAVKSVRFNTQSTKNSSRWVKAQQHQIRNGEARHKYPVKCFLVAVCLVDNDQHKYVSYETNDENYCLNHYKFSFSHFGLASVLLVAVLTDLLACHLTIQPLNGTFPWFRILLLLR